MKDYKILLYILLAVNLLAFSVAGYDKQQAKRHGSRVQERAFVLFSLCGGGFGTLAAFYLFRHKTHHERLMSIVWFLAIIEGAIAIFIYIR